MRLSELRGKPVVSIAEARRVGVVDDVLTDQSYRHLTALRVKTDGHGSGLLVAIENVRGIGPDAVTINSREALLRPEHATQYFSDPPLRSILNSRIVNDRGEGIGRVREVDVDTGRRSLRSLVYVAGMIDTILNRAHLVATSDVLGVGPGVITIRASANATPVGTVAGNEARGVGGRLGPDAVRRSTGEQVSGPGGAASDLDGSGAASGRDLDQTK